MKVFISWSGERSGAVARALHGWLPLVLHYVKPWLSEVDISAGARWADDVAKELEASNFGIICLTPENVGSPWVLFEAGALAKSIPDSRVIPLLLDLDFSDITGPLAQFQAKKLDKSGVREVVDSINNAAGISVPETQVQELFNALWPKFEKAVASIPESSSPATRTRPQAEILEDLVASVRALDARFREFSEASPGGVQYLERSSPVRDLADVNERMVRIISLDPDDPMMIMRIAEVFEEDNPVVFHAGVRAYRAARDNNFNSALRKLSAFRRAIKLATHTPQHAAQFGLNETMVVYMLKTLEEVGAHYRTLAQAARNAGGEDESPAE